MYVKVIYYMAELAFPCMKLHILIGCWTSRYFTIFGPVQVRFLLRTGKFRRENLQVDFNEI